jgi:toxin HigB-1
LRLVRSRHRTGEWVKINLYAQAGTRPHVPNQWVDPRRWTYWLGRARIGKQALTSWVKIGRCVIEILFASRKFQLHCEDPKQCAKHFGSLASSLQRRLAQLRAAASLADVFLGSPHPLTGDRAGQFAIALSGNFRLIFEPADDPLAISEDGTLILAAVKLIRALEVVDYHG